MDTDLDISGHYSRDKLLENLRTVLLAEGIDLDHLTIEALAPFDHFHGRGLEATEEMAGSLAIASTDHILDIGSGIGGPARYFANRFGCRVTGIDLTPEFCEVARVITQWVGLSARIVFEEGNALSLAFADESFDGAYSMNVAMNIADKAGFYREIYRVLKPAGWLALSEVAQGPTGAPEYPTPWAKTADTSFLATPSETGHGLVAAGFAIVKSRETTQQSLAFGARSRAKVERGEKPPNRAPQLIHGDLAAKMAANIARGMAAAKLIPIEILCKK